MEAVLSVVSAVGHSPGVEPSHPTHPGVGNTSPGRGRAGQAAGHVWSRGDSGSILRRDSESHIAPPAVPLTCDGRPVPELGMGTEPRGHATGLSPGEL